MDDVRWWSVADLAATNERLVPADLADVVPRVLAEGPPAHPLPRVSAGQRDADQRTLIGRVMVATASDELSDGCGVKTALSE